MDTPYIRRFLQHVLKCLDRPLTIYRSNMTIIPIIPIIPIHVQPTYASNKTWQKHIRLCTAHIEHKTHGNIQSTTEIIQITKKANTRKG
jgi:hypothetical protein